MQVSFLNTYICCCQSWDQFHCSCILTHLTVKFHFPICLCPPSLWETLNWWMILVLAKSVFIYLLLYVVWELEMHTVVSICWFSLTDRRKWSEIVHGILGCRFGECQSTQYGGLRGPYFCAFVNSDIKSLCQYVGCPVVENSNYVSQCYFVSSKPNTSVEITFVSCDPLIYWSYALCSWHDQNNCHHLMMHWSTQMVCNHSSLSVFSWF